MKAKLFFLFIFLASFISAQDSLLVKSEMLLNRTMSNAEDFSKILTDSGKDEMNGVISKVKRIKQDFKVYRSDFTDIDISNITGQKIMAQNFSEKYQKFFDLSGKSYLRYGYKTNEDRESGLNIAESVMNSNLTRLITDKVKYLSDLWNVYVDEKLKRNGITKTQWESMSEKDKEILSRNLKQ